MDAKPPKTSTDEDTALVHSTVSELAEAGRDVVVVVHSYGGIPGSDAMKGLARDERSGKGLKGGEVALMYICAWMLLQDKCVADYPKSLTSRARPRFEVPQVLFTLLKSAPPSAWRIICSQILTDQGDCLLPH